MLDKIDKSKNKFNGTKNNFKFNVIILMLLLCCLIKLRHTIIPVILTFLFLTNFVLICSYFLNALSNHVLT